MFHSPFSRKPLILRVDFCHSLSMGIFPKTGVPVNQAYLVTKNGTKQINNTNSVFFYSSADACAIAMAMSININSPLKSVLYIHKKSGH